MIKVEYIDHMGSDLTVVNAARVSFDKEKTVFDDADRKLIRYLVKHHHTSPFRHPQISIRVHVPIFLARQLDKHQVGLTKNEVSRRYVDTPPDIYYPDEWRSKPDGSVKQGSGNTHPYSGSIEDFYETHVRNCLMVYNVLLEHNVAPEMARMVLPQSMVTSWIWTGSLAAFAHMYTLRFEGHAQREAQIFAQELDAVIKPLFPECWELLTRGTPDEASNRDTDSYIKRLCRWLKNS
jgi:thymidylate synthase (FAD)